MHQGRISILVIAISLLAGCAQMEESKAPKAVETSVQALTFTPHLPFEMGDSASIPQAFGGSFSHTGKLYYSVDFIRPYYTPVLAVYGGTVSHVYSTCASGDQGCNHAVGNEVIVDHGGGTYSAYYHLEPGSITVSVGSPVCTGLKLGEVGTTGYQSGSHIHFHFQNVPGNIFDDNGNTVFFDGFVGAPSPSVGQVVTSLNAILVGCTPPAWWCDPIDSLHDLGILSGECDDYQSGQTFNRAALAKILALAVGVDDSSAFGECDNPFDDVDSGDWYAPYVIALAYLTYGDGVSVFSTSTGSFNPSDVSTRCETLKAVVEAFDVAGSNQSLGFDDVDEIPEWCYPYVQAGADEGIIDGNANNFHPNEQATVGEVAVMVANALDDPGVPGISSSDFSHPSCGGSGETSSQCDPCDDPGAACASSGFICVGYADYDVDFCTKECSSDTQCPLGYFCHDAGICWVEALEYACYQDDVWKTDPCGHWLQIVDSCGSQEYCMDGACIPSCVSSCAGKECGPDGCGGSCGSCDSDEICDDGDCKGVCQPNCLSNECGPDGCGGSCGSCDLDEICDDGDCKGVCQPNCLSKECGPDGCGGSCGSCDPDEICDNGDCIGVCQPNCLSKECGQDGCGGSCGSCDADEICDDGDCKGVCQPNCVSKECGQDGCGGSCGSCDADEICDDGDCKGVCQPSCLSKECGQDGCGGSCGSCDADEICDDGDCKGVCQPNCLSKECGPDDCGGSCGNCSGGEVCFPDGTCGFAPICGDGNCDGGEDCSNCSEDCGWCDGTGDCCEEQEEAGCRDVGIMTCVCAQDANCCQTQWDSFCVDHVEQFDCGDCGGPAYCPGYTGTSGCCTDDDLCGWASNSICDCQAACAWDIDDCDCVKDCEGKECGDDGCGGPCGDCPEVGSHCVDGICKQEDPNPCLPDCVGKECGEDGCGGVCDVCPLAAPVCDEYQCKIAEDAGPDGEDDPGGNSGCSATNRSGTAPVEGLLILFAILLITWRRVQHHTDICLR